MQVPKQITQFVDEVRSASQKLAELVADYNDLAEKKQKILEISKEYLRVQPLTTEEVRQFLVQGIDIELDRLKLQFGKQVDHIYLDIQCGKPKQQ